MSYILDALKRADAERARGAVPGLHAQPLTNTNNTDSAVPKNLLWWLSAAALLIGAAAWGLWNWPTAAPVQSPPVAVASLVAPTVPVAASPQPATAIPNPPPVSPAATPVPTPALAPAPPPAVKAPTPSGTTGAITATGVSTKSAPVVPAAAPVVPSVTSAPLLDELPEDLRLQLPTLTITGAVYAADPRQRLLLINNLVLPQGSQVATGLVLQEILPHSAVFNFHETRFRVKY